MVNLQTCFFFNNKKATKSLINQFRRCDWDYSIIVGSFIKHAILKIIILSLMILLLRGSVSLKFRLLNTKLNSQARSPFVVTASQAYSVFAVYCRIGITFAGEHTTQAPLPCLLSVCSWIQAHRNRNVLTRNLNMLI